MWQTEMAEMVRVMVDDQAESLFSDSSILKGIVMAARLVSMEMTFTQTFLARMDDLSIDPDPTDSETLDDSFVNLVCLRAACLIERGEAMKAAREGIAGKDGGASFDLRDRAKHKITLLDKNWCKEYEQAKLEYKSGLSAVAGQAILTPVRVYMRSQGKLFG